MAEINNFTEITENFDTIKTLLNSIRAQGILNTSDVDKLLAGINSKLEKLNTEEDIDLIKIFLSELKQNLDERHGVLLSKFGAIESLFSNLLKNSADALKSSEVKELFDIVATNLSVFSREVVSQKETLTDITLRLDAMRSDDSQKKEIIKSVSMLKNDLERLNNGFDSIVLSLNENFKTIIKTISAVDQSEAINKFGDEIADVVNSSNTILSALQMLDKKNLQIEDAMRNLATQDDITSAKKWLSDLVSQNHELSTSIDNLSDKYYKIDNLAEKIDASVNIIAGLKAVIADTDEQNTQSVLDKLAELENQLKDVSENKSFEEFKQSLEAFLEDVSKGSENLQSALVNAADEIQKINDNIKALDINVNFQNLLAKLENSEHDIKEHVDVAADKISQLVEVNVTRTLNDISSSADTLSSRLKETRLAISDLCEKSFNELTSNITDLKGVVAQIDDNNVSANNAIFSNITDRLAIFENSLKTSLDKQEESVSTSSSQLVEQITNIKNLAGVLDYKLDASVIEVNNAKREFADLKTAVENVLALDFVNSVKDLRVDLYAAKQDISNALETSTNDMSDKFTNDLYGKYELLISKLDSVEDELKQAQAVSLNGLKGVLDNISSSIVDILSYVSAKSEVNTDVIDVKLANITEIVKDSNLNYVENVRDVVEVIRKQVENNLLQIQKDTSSKIEAVNTNVAKSADSIKEEIKYSYNKILEIQDNFDEIKESLNVNNVNLNNNINGILSSADSLRSDFDVKMLALKNALLDKVADFKQEFTCENADKISELKFSAENLHSKNIQNSIDLKNELRNEITQVIQVLKENVEELSGKVTKSTEVQEASNEELSTSVAAKTDEVVNGFNTLENAVNSLASTTTSSLASTLAQILDNFVSLKALMNNLNEKAADDLRKSVDDITEDFSRLRDKINTFDANIDEDMARQISIIESNFEDLSLSISDLFAKSEQGLEEKLNSGLANISENMSSAIAERLDGYKLSIENLFDGIVGKNDSQAEFIKERVLELNVILKNNIEEQNKAAALKLEEIASSLKSVLDENIEVTAADYASLKAKLEEFAQGIEAKNSDFVVNIKTLLDDVTKYIDSGFDVHSQEINAKFDEISSKVQRSSNIVLDLNNDVTNKFEELTASVSDALSVVKSLNDETELKLNDKFAKLTFEIQQTSEILNGIKDETNVIVETKIEEVTSKVQQVSNLLLDLSDSLTAGVNNKVDGINSGIAELKDCVDLSLSEKSVTIMGRLETLSEEVFAKTSEIVSSSLNTANSVKEGLTSLINTKFDEVKSSLDSNVLGVSSGLSEFSDEFKAVIEEKINSLVTNSTQISADELQTMEALTNRILESVKQNNQNTTTCKDLMIEFIKKEFDEVTGNIEKETDVIVKDLLEQFSLLKDSQKDELDKLTIHVESSIEDYIFNYLNDLKSYLDVKTDSTVLNQKLDNLRNEISASVDEVLENVNKLLEASVFSSALSDFKTANEILIGSMADKLNKQIQEFVNDNVATRLDDKLNLLDKKFVDTIVDKYEEIKLVASSYNSSYDRIQASVKTLTDNFEEVKDEINSNLTSLVSGINDSISDLKVSFADLKAQILNKSFDEAFQASINNQITGIEKLIQEQFGYLEDINELCGNNLPELTEMNTIVKYGIQQSVKDLSEKVDAKEEQLVKSLADFKADIVTQFINVFNQVSFVAEQEEILDFIQEKHSDLITILSHIVTTVEGVETVKDNLAVVDMKMDSLKEDIDLINEKITSIISADGDINYVYSLQDLESDIANLRLVLNEMRDNTKSKEFDELINSTNSIYGLVESIKSEMPKFEADEFKRDFDALSEDIVSISTRTNKLILASDESYKTLQDNLQDFKLVINDLDERTKNFAHEAGIDRLDNKLGSINTMIQNGAKTNQVFNQVFEYLAEWVDKAGEQINTISDRVETLDDIGQIKVMLEDLKAEAEDNSESTELIEALGNVFDKQTKRISSLEAKLDRMIVENTINNKNNKIDMTPLEETLNRFLVAIDDKMASQQDKINSLEAKLSEVMSSIDSKDTAQLTKKVGGMDRQIAKLNKSIEKIASHVVEK